MRIWLHIGLRKTGTTALQDWCLENDSALRSKGFLYLRISENRPTCGPLARALSRDPAQAQTMIATILDQLHGPEADALLSSEDFSDLAPEQILPLTTALQGHEVTILLWLRRQDRLAEALYKQIVKWSGNAPDISAFLRGPDIDNLDYARLLNRWQKACSGISLRPQIYDEATPEHQPDSIASFFGAIGRPDLSPANSQDLRANISPAASLVERYKTVSAQDVRSLRRANRRLMQKMGSAAGGHDDLFSPDISKALMERFAVSNAQTREIWFPDRVSLFAPPTETLTPPPANKRMIETFERFFEQERAKAKD